MTSPPIVAITRRYPDDVINRVIPHADILMPPDQPGSLGLTEIRRHGERVAAIITQGDLRIDRELLEATPRLRIVANASIGVNNFDGALMRARGVWGTNTPDAFVDATADCALGLLVALARRLGEADRFVRAGRWNRFEPGRWDGVQLRGKTLGVVGYGRIGRAVAARAKAFGLQVVHHTRSGSDHPEWRTLDALLAEADFVSLHVPLTAETHRLIDASRLARMKPGARLINLARGPVVDEAALIAALETGRLAGAALDVFEDEPNVPEALRRMDNVLLTPHLGGGSREGRLLAQSICVENVHRVLLGGTPLVESTAVAIG